VKIALLSTTWRSCWYPCVKKRIAFAYLAAQGAGPSEAPRYSLAARSTQASISVCAVAGCSNPRHWTHGHGPLRGLEQPLPFRIFPERLQQHPHGVFGLVAAVACVPPSCHLFAVFVAKTREKPIVARNPTYTTALADSTRCHLLQVI